MKKQSLAEFRAQHAVVDVVTPVVERTICHGSVPVTVRAVLPRAGMVIFEKGKRITATWRERQLYDSMHLGIVWED